MFVIIGGLVVFLSMLGGFMIAGGNPIVLLHVSEFVVIGGMAIGVMIMASPTSAITHMIHEVLGSLKGGGPSKDDYLDLMKLLYEIFNIGRKNGLIAVDEHIGDPKNSSIFTKYPSFLNNHEYVEFLVNSLRPIVDGKIKPEQLDSILEAEIKAKKEDAHHTIAILHLVGDSLPGIGIVAAVLGIINTMSSIADGPEAVGQKVAAALTGTFLGIFAAYGFINPMAERIHFSQGGNFLYLNMIKQAVSTFAKGMAPLMAIEIARRSMDHAVQPGADELEKTLKGLNSGG